MKNKILSLHEMLLKAKTLFINPRTPI